MLIRGSIFQVEIQQIVFQTQNAPRPLHVLRLGDGNESSFLVVVVVDDDGGGHARTGETVMLCLRACLCLICRGSLDRQKSSIWAFSHPRKPPDKRYVPALGLQSADTADLSPSAQP